MDEWKEIEKFWETQDDIIINRNYISINHIGSDEKIKVVFNDTCDGETYPIELISQGDVYYLIKPDNRVKSKDHYITIPWRFNNETCVTNS